MKQSTSEILFISITITFITVRYGVAILVNPDGGTSEREEVLGHLGERKYTVSASPNPDLDLLNLNKSLPQALGQ